MLTAVRKSEQQLTDQLEHVGNYIAAIIADQEKIIKVSKERIVGYKRDLRALKFRLKPYVGKNPKRKTETYYRLKDEYTELVQRVDVLRRTILLAEESIVHAKLGTVPGQTEDLS